MLAVLALFVCCLFVCLFFEVVGRLPSFLKHSCVYCFLFSI